MVIVVSVCVCVSQIEKLTFPQQSGPETAVSAPRAVGGMAGGGERTKETKKDSFGFGLGNHYAECYPG